jgi:hypothetical protein
MEVSVVQETGCELFLLVNTSDSINGRYYITRTLYNLRL